MGRLVQTYNPSALYHLSDSIPYNTSITKPSSQLTLNWSKSKYFLSIPSKSNIHILCYLTHHPNHYNSYIDCAQNSSKFVKKHYSQLPYIRLPLGIKLYEFIYADKFLICSKSQIFLEKVMHKHSSFQPILRLGHWLYTYDWISRIKNSITFEVVFGRLFIVYISYKINLKLVRSRSFWKWAINTFRVY